MAFLGEEKSYVALTGLHTIVVMACGIGGVGTPPVLVVFLCSFL